MRLIPKAHIEAISSSPNVLWEGGPPDPADPLWGWVSLFIADVGSLMSLTDAMRKHSVPLDTWETLLASSPWVCNQINGLISVRRVDAELSTLQAAIGHRQMDDKGQVVTDADGVPIRKGRDTVAAKYIFEREERAAGIGVGVGVPMLQAASEDALSVVRRSNGLAQAYPWTTGRPDGSWVLEVGMFNASQVAKLSAYGVELPDIAGMWFVEVAADRREVLAVRRQDYGLLELSIGSGEAGSGPGGGGPSMGLLCDGSDSRGPGGVDIAGRISPPKAGGSRNEEDHADQ